MSTSYKKLFLTVNAETGQFVDPREGSKLSSEFYPALCYGEMAVLCLSFVDSQMNPYEFNANDRFEMAMDINFLHAADPLMTYSDSNSFDIAGDWADINRAQGRISGRVNCLTAPFASKLGGAERSQCWIEIKKYLSGSVNPSVVLRDKCYAKNVVMTNEGDPGSSAPQYYKIPEVDSRLQTKADKVAAAVAGNFAALDGNGNLADSGRKHADYALASHAHTASQITDLHSHANKATLDAVPDHSAAAALQVLRKAAGGGLEFATPEASGGGGLSASQAKTADYTIAAGDANKLTYIDPSVSTDKVFSLPDPATISNKQFSLANLGSAVLRARVAGQSDICAGGTPASSSGTAANAFDGSTVTSCDFTAQTGTIQYDFGAGVTKAVNRVRLYSDAANGAPATFKIQYSSDGTNWYDAYSQMEALAWAAAGWHDVYFRNVAAFRYWRISVLSTKGAANGKVFEVEMFDQKIQDGRSEVLILPGETKNLFCDGANYLIF